MKIICIANIQSMDISISLEKIVVYISNISMHVFIHKSANDILIYVNLIQYSICKEQWLCVSPKGRTCYDAN